MKRRPLITFMFCMCMCLSWWSMDAFAFLDSPGYDKVMRRNVYIHGYRPTQWNQSGKDPVIIALHYKSGNGQEFLPGFQTMADQFGVMVVCPDSEGHFDWDPATLTFNSNMHMLKMTLKLLPENAFKENDVYLLGHDTGARFVIRALFAEPSWLFRIKGAIISSTAIKTQIDTREWGKPRLKPEMKTIPLVYLYSRDDTQLVPEEVHWTRDVLRELGMNVYYREDDGYGHLYPDHLNPFICEWIHNAEKGLMNQNNIRPGKIPGPVIVSENISSLDFDRQSALEYKVRFAYRTPEWEREDTVKKHMVRKNIRVQLQVFDDDQQLAYKDEKVYFGDDVMSESRRDYHLNRYNAGAVSESRSQVDVSSRVDAEKEIELIFNVPEDKQQQVAALFIYINTELAGFRVWPNHIDVSEFKPLSHVIVPVTAS